MAKLPTLRRLFKGDFKPEHGELVDKLITSINNGFDNVYDALNNKITLKNNILCDIKDFSIQVNSSGIPTNALVLNVSFASTVSIVSVGKITNSSNPQSFPAGGVTITWEQESAGFIKIKHITGLTSGETYSIRVVIYGDEG